MSNEPCNHIKSSGEDSKSQCWDQGFNEFSALTHSRGWRSAPVINSVLGLVKKAAVCLALVLLLPRHQSIRNPTPAIRGGQHTPVTA